MSVLNVRMSEDLLGKIDNELAKLKQLSPGMKITKSDLIRNILELHFGKQGGTR